MKVSIVTVVYNAENTIRDTIESVLSQTYKNIEYIIVDGGSTDGTIKIIQAYQKKIANFVSEPDNGIYDAMNKGIRLATGDVVGILNADDFYSNDNVLLDVMEQFHDNQVDCVFGDLVYVKQSDPHHVMRYWESGNFRKNKFKSGWHPPHPTFFVKKAVYDKCGMFNLALPISADYELMLRFLEANDLSSAYINKVLVNMRLGGTTNNSFKNIIQANKECCRAFTLNDMKVPLLFFFKKPLKKLLQYIQKPKRI